MAYLVVENFSAGLDTRRHPLTARPGTLQKLKNAHVSRGGEIEKRKAFTVFQDLATNPNLVGCKGLQATSDRIYVFQSGTEGSPDVSVGSVWIQYLCHPQRLFMGVAGPDLVDIVYSTLYGGKPFVLAKWSDGSVYPYLDGKIIEDFFIGRAESWMAGASNQASLYNLATTLAWQIKGNTFGLTTTGWNVSQGYTGAGAYVQVSAPIGTAFSPSATADSPLTVTTTTIAEYKDPVPEQLAKGSFAISGGSAGISPVVSRYVRFLSGLPKIMNVYFNGAPGIEEPGGWTGFDNSNNTAATNGWNYGPRLGYNMAFYLDNFPRNRPTFTNTPTGDATYVIDNNSGVDGCTINLFVPNTNSAYYDNHSALNGTPIEIEFAADPTLTASNLAEFVDPTTVAPSPYNAGRWIARYGTMTGGQTNAITSVKVDGVEVLGNPVKWAYSNADMMMAVAARITSYSSTPEYTAEGVDNKVVIKAAPGSGIAPNGKPITVTVVGNVTTSNYSSFSGGAVAVPAQQQTVRYELGGSFSVGSTVQLVATKKLDPSNPVYWGKTRVTGITPVTALTFKTKAHVTGGSSLFFSGVNQPNEFGDNGVGAGFINMSNNNGGNEVLTALALYQGQLAAFSRRTVQVWSIDTDPANNRQGQVLSNTGAFGQKSVVSVGEIDVFYLSDSGIRSLRARDSSNSAVVNDVGTPIDNLVLADIAGFTDAQKTACPAIIEPIDGRYWLAIGSKIYVFSYFPNSQVAAWSTYEPGFAVEHFTTKDGRVYARAGNTVYLYGGASGSQYDSSEVEVILPYLDGGKPAHRKTLMGLDMTVEGGWQVFIGMDPLSVEARDPCGTITQPTFSLGRVMANGMGTHVGVKMVCQAAGYARLANLICHFEFNESD